MVVSLTLEQSYDSASEVVLKDIYELIYLTTT